MYPIQPYFALSSNRYYKRPIEAAGIAHIYEYSSEHTDNDSVVVIPDGCIDLMIDENHPEDVSYAAGSVLKGTHIALKEGHRYFGVRFMPGHIPSFIDGSMPDFIGNTIDLSLCTNVSEPLIGGILDHSSFQDKADFFLRFYGDTEKESAISNPQTELASYIRDMIEKSHGLIKVKEIAEETGYTERYINKVFKTVTGMAPKFYCRIMRFQQTIDHLDHDTSIAMTALAIDHGYYDQSQFNREFREFTLLTPSLYRKTILQSRYAEKFILS
ncbi:MAG: helix-turn-helix domain-containing protein [Lachnospiraceae bacterium]|nr:helix-turn-helix domain-containing protein [Lachnospiraceae bacterium]